MQRGDFKMYIDRIEVDRDKIPQGSQDAYAFELPALRNLKFLTLEKQVTFLVGENGAGKSTLLEAIAIAYGFNPEGGSKNFNFSTYQSHSGLYQALRFTRNAFPKDGYFLRAESFYNVATSIDEMDGYSNGVSSFIQNYGGRSLHEQSHGESFLALVLNRFRGKGLYILDEPEAALSPTRQLSLIARMGELNKNHSQFIIATHSPILMSYPDADIFLLSEQGIHRTEYEETEHYKITKQFLENPERMLKELLD